MRTSLLPHNKNAYKKVVNAFETTNRTCVVHPTGTGKSYLIAAVSELFKNVLVLGPNEFVLNQVRSVLSWRKTGVEYMTYAWLNLHGATGVYDLICLDEFHRAGANEWGDAVNDLMAQQPSAKVFGTTATPIRHLDGERNMADEIFHGNIASEITVGEAMSRNILPIPTYVTGLFDFKNTANATKEKIMSSKYISNDEKMRRIEKLSITDDEWERSSGMPTILRKYISKDTRRIIVFCSDVPTLTQMSNTVYKWFCDARIKISNIYEIHNEMSDSKQKKVMEDFESDGVEGCKIMMSVNMLNEGVHIPRVGAVLMLRTTASRIIYMQQMGRCLTASNTERPVILDMVDNISNTSVSHELKRDFDVAEIKKAESTGGKYIPRQLHITDYTKTVREVITSLQHGTSNNRLTVEEVMQAIYDFVTEHDRLPSHSVNSSNYERSLAYRMSNRLDDLNNDEQFSRMYEYYRTRDLPTFDKNYNIVLDYCKKYDHVPWVSKKKDDDTNITEGERDALKCWIWLRNNYRDDERIKAIQRDYSTRKLREEEIVRRIELLTEFIKKHHRRPNGRYSKDEVKLRGYLNQFQSNYGHRKDVQRLFALIKELCHIPKDVNSIMDEFRAFCNDKKRLPSRFSKDPYEVSLYKLTRNRKELANDNEYRRLREQYKKVPLTRSEEIALVAEHCKQTGRLPSKSSCTVEVYRAWQNIKRTMPEKADELKSQYATFYYLSDKDICNHVDELIQFINENHRRPSSRREESKLQNYLTTLLRPDKADNPDVKRLVKLLETIPTPECHVKRYTKQQATCRRCATNNHNYRIVPKLQCNDENRYVIFYTPDTKRSVKFEEICLNAGLTIKEWDNQQTD